MKYHCGHSGCDICGARTCADTVLNKYYVRDLTYYACDSCVKKAIVFAVKASEEFSTIIDLDKSCGKNTK